MWQIEEAVGDSVININPINNHGKKKWNKICLGTFQLVQSVNPLDAPKCGGVWKEEMVSSKVGIWFFGYFLFVIGLV